MLVLCCPGTQEFEGMKRQYTKHTDAHGCLGILRVNEGTCSTHIFSNAVTYCPAKL